MADVTVPVQVLEDSVENNTAGIVIAIGETFEITGLDGRMGKTVILMVGNGGTVTFDAGINPAAQRSGLGALTVSITSTDEHAIVLEGQRYLDSPEASATERNTITGSVADAQVTMHVWQIGNSV